ncbi:MAG: class I SAM-dependent methyltransferase [Akkermansiaceae bacterium]|jgi:2-polyprenyl-3-methyl-5-hydroxy-6-metoxy-1,4-benzoquinol methylase
MKSNRKSGDPGSNRKGGTPYWEKMKPHKTERAVQRERQADSRKPHLVVTSKAEKTAEKGWDQVAQWYEKLVGDEGSDYHKHVIVPALMKRLGDLTGKHVIDVCCGQGFLGKMLRHAGAAKVQGIDASPQLIAAARQRHLDDPRQKYLVADACQPAAWADGSHDIAICLMAVHDVPDLRGLFQNIAGSLTQDGRALLVFMHPCFRFPQHTHWGWDAEQQIQYRRVDRYGTEHTIQITTHPGRKNSQQTKFYHRPLPSYVNALSKAGLAITGCDELFTHRRSQIGPRSRAEHFAAEQFPMFMLWELRLCPGIQ